MSNNSTTGVEVWWETKHLDPVLRFDVKKKRSTDG